MLLCQKVRFYNESQDQDGVFNVNLLDIDEKHIHVPEEDFPSIVTLEAIRFQNLCRDLASVESDRVTIATANGKFCMASTGDGAQVRMRPQRYAYYYRQGMYILGGRNSTIDTEQKDGEPICNIFPLKLLTAFTKATKLSTLIHVRMKQNFPIIIDYPVSCIGILRFCLAPYFDEAEETNQDTINPIVQRLLESTPLPLPTLAPPPPSSPSPSSSSSSSAAAAAAAEPEVRKRAPKRPRPLVALKDE